MVELIALQTQIQQALTNIGDFSYVFQFQSQDIDQENTSIYSYPAALVELDVESVTQLIQRSDYNLIVNIHILEKELNNTMYGSINLTGKVYSALQGQHFQQLTSPLYYVGAELDREPYNFSKTVMTFNTILTVRSLPNIFTYSTATPSIAVTYTYSQVQGTQSYTDYFTYSGN
jgi:hypothetical protein